MACLLSLTAVDESSLPASEVHLNMYGGSTDGMSHWSKCLVLLIKKKNSLSQKWSKNLGFTLFGTDPAVQTSHLYFSQNSPHTWDEMGWNIFQLTKSSLTLQWNPALGSPRSYGYFVLPWRNTHTFSDTKNLVMRQIMFYKGIRSRVYIDTLDRYSPSAVSRLVLDRHPDRYSVDTIDQQSVHGRPSVYQLIWIDEKLVVSRPTVDRDVYRSATRPQMPLVPMIQCGHQRPHSEIPTYIIFYNFIPFTRSLKLAMIIFPLLILYILIQVSIFTNSTWIPDAIKKPSCLEVQLW